MRARLTLLSAILLLLAACSASTVYAKGGSGGGGSSSSGGRSSSSSRSRSSKSSSSSGKSSSSSSKGRSIGSSGGRSSGSWTSSLIPLGKASYYTRADGRNTYYWAMQRVGPSSGLYRQSYRYRRSRIAAPFFVIWAASVALQYDDELITEECNITSAFRPPPPYPAPPPTTYPPPPALYGTGSTPLSLPSYPPPLPSAASPSVYPPMPPSASTSVDSSSDGDDDDDGGEDDSSEQPPSPPAVDLNAQPGVREVLSHGYASFDDLNGTLYEQTGLFITNCYITRDANAWRDANAGQMARPSGGAWSLGLAALAAALLAMAVL